MYMGIHSERGNEPSKQVRNVEKLILEPTGKDIALLKLEKYVNFYNNVDQYVTVKCVFNLRFDLKVKV